TFPAVAIIFGVIAAFALVARLSRNLRLAFATFLVLPSCILSVGFRAVKTYSEASSSRELAAYISKLPDEVEVASLQSPAPGLPYYLGRHIHLITATGGEI